MSLLRPKDLTARMLGSLSLLSALCRYRVSGPFMVACCSPAEVTAFRFAVISTTGNRAWD